VKSLKIEKTNHEIPAVNFAREVWMFSRRLSTAPIILILCIAHLICGMPKNSVTIESVMVSCLRKQVTISFVAILANLVADQDWKECHIWLIILNVNNTFHSQKSLCGCGCQGIHEVDGQAPPGGACPIPLGPVSVDDGTIMSCSFKAKLNLEQKTVLNLQLQSENETYTSNNLFVEIRCTERHTKPEVDLNSLNETRLPTINWSVNPDGWISSYLSLYHSLVRSAMKLNLPPQLNEQAPPVNQSFDFPVFVMNLPHRNDRRRSTEGLLHTLGFTHVIFPNVTLASDIDPDALVENQFMKPEAIDAILDRKDKGPGALRAYLANALDQVSETAPASLAHVLQLTLWGMFALASNEVFLHLRGSDTLSCAR
jgi:hypothetical protein